MIAYYNNSNVLLVKKLLNHNCVENSIKYIDATFTGKGEDKFDVETASNVEDAKKFLAEGYEYICDKMGVVFFGDQKGSVHPQVML